jgi:hypothetical protein
MLIYMWSRIKLIKLDERGSVSCVFCFISSWSALVPILSVSEWLPGVKFARFVEGLGKDSGITLFINPVMSYWFDIIHMGQLG